MYIKKTDKKIPFVKILIPALIVITIIIIWFIKAQQTPSQSTNNPDFVLEVTSIDLTALKEYKLPIIIDFGADTCIPCKQMAPVLVKLNAEMQQKAIIKFVDISKSPGAANGFPVQAIPTQIFINADGTPYIPSENIKINFEMYTFKATGEHAFTVHQGALTEKQMREILADMGVKE